MKHMVEERVQQDAWQGALGMGQVGQVTYEITIVGGNKNNQRFIYLHLFTVWVPGFWPISCSQNMALAQYLQFSWNGHWGGHLNQFKSFKRGFYVPSGYLT